MLFSHILLTEVFAGPVSEDKDKDDDNNYGEEENNDDDTDLEDKDGSNDKNKYKENRSINNNNKDNIMPPKLKQASMLPTKATIKNPEWRNSQALSPRCSKSPHRLSSPTL